MTWTRFMDMHSGGGQKHNFNYCYIEAPEAEARSVFYSRYGTNPDRVSCTCCGEDYSVSEAPTLARATAYERNCGYKDGDYVESPRQSEYCEYVLVGVDEYLTQPGIAIIYNADIQPHERNMALPEQGYVWRG